MSWFCDYCEASCTDEDEIELDGCTYLVHYSCSMEYTDNDEIAYRAIEITRCWLFMENETSDEPLREVVSEVVSDDDLLDEIKALVSDRKNNPDINENDLYDDLSMSSL